MFLGARLLCELAALPVVGRPARNPRRGNTAGAALAVSVLRRCRFDFAGSGRRALYAFLFAGLIGMTVTATNGLIWRAAAELLAPGEAIAVWLAWWLGDTAGFLVVAPALLSAKRPRLDRTAVRPVVWLLFTAALSALAVTDVLHVPVRGLLVFPPFMMLIWVGMTERVSVGSLHVLVLAAVAIAGAAAGGGLFGTLPPVTKLLMVWGFATTAALIILAMTTTLAERERAEAALAASAADYQALVEGTPAAIVPLTPPRGS